MLSALFSNKVASFCTYSAKYFTCDCEVLEKVPIEFFHYDFFEENQFSCDYSTQTSSIFGSGLFWFGVIAFSNYFLHHVLLCNLTPESFNDVIKCINIKRDQSNK